MTDFSSMTGPQLVAVYNTFVAQAQELGIMTATLVSRFSGLDAGRSRCEKMEALVTEAAGTAGTAPAEGRPAVAPTAEETAETAANLAEVSQTNEGEEPAAAPPANSGADTSDVSWSEMTGVDLREDDDEMAKKRKVAKAAKTPRKPRATNGSGETLHSYTDVWNAMVPRAVKAGIKGVKHHTSDFESHEKAKARIAWLEKELRK